MKWDKINHGGTQTENISKKYAIFIGRYQPYHFGHINLIQQKINDGIPVIIMVRNIEPDNKNPFTTEQTINMIQKYHDSKNEDVLVISIPDIESVNYGRSVGYEINEYIPTEEVSFISATKIRNSINENNQEWKNMLDSVLHEDIIKYLK